MKMYVICTGNNTDEYENSREIVGVCKYEETAKRIIKEYTNPRCKCCNQSLPVAHEYWYEEADVLE